MILWGGVLWHHPYIYGEAVIYVVSLKDAKQYLRVDYNDDDKLIESILTAAKKLCMDVLMTSDIAVLNNSALGDVAILYATAYLYEHREEADYHDLALTLRGLLGGSRREVF